ncbi:imidazoleglycerol-phosphate dehydratase HisB [Roseospirillum parvum]|uniref:Imidazoleglycerol-phosphate dehydratase n=1 Tax=Roseospirillum parvum TaxID=83401 RepID=A0A1G8DR43_9PROT|nr:imidazoleglycerol-phosphate dehydratase HisB [Roseospirillum parvum]SDH59920.1 imidazoleglycerol-phosphate dehydratase [Roseospirillum parvum]
MRQANLERVTTETRVSVSVDLEGSGAYDVRTGVGFLDHMIEQLSRHSLIDLTVLCEGDTHIDFHHTTEDTALAIGAAISQALGDRKGIQRFGSALVAMDEALSRAVVDLSNRPYLVWKVDFSRDKIGEFDTELFREFFQALSQTGGMTLHIENHYGTNAHHIAESCFKATARALRQACEIDARKADAVPSTKGRL